MKKANILSNVLGYGLAIILIAFFVILGSLFNHHYTNEDIKNIIRIVDIILIVLLLIANIIIIVINRKKYSRLKTGEDLFNYIIDKKKEIDSSYDQMRVSLIKKYHLSLAYTYGLFFINLLSISLFCFSDATSIASALSICFLFTFGNFISKTLSTFFDNKTNLQKCLSKNEFKKIYDIVDSVFKENGIKKEVYIYGGEESALSIIEQKNIIEIFIGYPLLRFLNEKELIAGLYHELAHLINKDTEFGYKQYQLMNKIEIIISYGIVGSVLFSPFAEELKIEHDIFNQLSSIHYEKKADEIIKQKHLEQDFINGLSKLEAYNRYSNSLIDGLFVPKLEEYPSNYLDYMYGFFVEFVNNNYDYIINSLNNSIPRRFQTHPELNERMKSLGVTLIDFNLDNHDCFAKEIKYFENYYDLINGQTLKNMFNEQHAAYIAFVDRIKEFEQKEVHTISEMIEAMNEYFNFNEFKKALSLAYEIICKDSNISKAKFLIGVIETRLNLSNKGEKYLKEFIESGLEVDFIEPSIEVLGEFYCSNGRKEDLEWLRAKQINSFNKIKDLELASTINPNDKLDSYDKDDITNSLIEIIINKNTINKLIMFTKTINETTVNHVILVFNQKEKIELIQSEVDSIYKQLDYLFDNKSYSLRMISTIQLNQLSFLKKYIIYSK